ncbi:peptidoglycan-binding protein [Streptomyces sp. ISL-22]|uniref:peptidoglycan-binding domain-containing protein n=1 Tax=unclassified Streptomyces TaxID=2593676 RepID=UPI001BE8F0BC|nr:MULTISPECIES: peptidoglycan-binding protein [unclassified Streptomyces]MBT2419078.1 peptidoglycan-binding protein [Streptomyces sp. ISL-24]MBT2431173.1 peptidoglycan-binding protein [Streptomyces sp. ISL-22]
MRSNALTRTVISLTAVVGLAAGTVAAAGTSFAASPQATKAAVSAQDVSVLAVNNLGLNTERAKNWQCWLRDWNYNPGTIDGQLGTNSWKAAQRFLNDRGHNAGTVDGALGPNTIRALQRYLNTFGYGLAVDGDAGPATRAAFWDFNATGC